MLTISKVQARRFLIEYHCLDEESGLSGKQGILKFIHRVGGIQYDPLNVAGRNHELVLQSRIKDFRIAMLEEFLYKDRLLMDAYDKNMCICAVNDWAYFSFGRKLAAERTLKGDPSILNAMPEVLEIIGSRGPISSLDLDYNQVVHWSWSDTRLARAALESLYHTGDLIIHHKTNTRKYYDLAHRHIPPEIINSVNPNTADEDHYAWYVLWRIGSVGLLWNRPSDVWLGIDGMKSEARNAAFKVLLAQDKITEVRIENIETPFFIRKCDELILKKSILNPITRSYARIIAPLDNLLWDRNIIRTIFDFDYKWEVYTPVKDRNYGYYVLPVLYNDRMVARFEPEKCRRAEKMPFKHWWWEKNTVVNDVMKSEINACLERFSDCLGFSGFDRGILMKMMDTEAVQAN